MRFSDLEKRIAQLRGRQAFLVQASDTLSREIGIAKARQSYREPVEAVLDALEARFHAKSLGLLESLLTAFLCDVVPREEGPAQAVSLTMDTQRGLPALQIAVLNGEHPEDALNGRGGSVANVLSAGLRFAALSRATRGVSNGFRFRPFLILDEADCWLRFSRVSNFSDVVYQLARDLGMQILMISHHPAEMLKGYPVHLEREIRTVEGAEVPVPKARYVPMNEEALVSGGEPSTVDGEGHPLEADERESAGLVQPVHHPRMASIRLRDFMAHVDTTIPLHPLVTILSGDNDIGKSAVTEAFRAICYNEASDMVIRHGASRSEVVLSLVDGETRQTLHWIRLAKGAPKVRYVLKDAQGAVLKDTPAAKNVPDWVRNLLGVDFLDLDGKDPLDVQIGHQKSPVFLLDKSPSQRAAILDMGRESQHLRRLRDRWKKQVDEDRRLIREGEKRLARLHTLLQQMEPLADIESEVETYGAIHQRCSDRVERIQQKVSVLEAAQRSRDAVSMLNVLPELPALPDGAAWSRIAMRDRLWASGESRHREKVFWETRAVPTAVSVPEGLSQAIPSSFRRASLAREAFFAQKRVHVFVAWSAPVLPALPMVDLKPRVALLRSAKALWASRQAFRGMAEIVLPSLVGLREKIDGIFRGYQMGVECSRLKKEMSDTEASLNEESAALVAVQKEKDALLKQWGVCPFCGQGPASDHGGHST